MDDELRKRLEKLFIEAMTKGVEPETFKRATSCLVEKEERLQKADVPNNQD